MHGKKQFKQLWWVFTYLVSKAYYYYYYYKYYLKKNLLSLLLVLLSLLFHNDILNAIWVLFLEVQQHNIILFQINSTFTTCLGYVWVYCRACLLPAPIQRRVKGCLSNKPRIYSKLCLRQQQPLPFCEKASSGPASSWKKQRCEKTKMLKKQRCEKSVPTILNPKWIECRKCGTLDDD